MTYEYYQVQIADRYGQEDWAEFRSLARHGWRFVAFVPTIQLGNPVYYTAHLYALMERKITSTGDNNVKGTN